MKAALSVAALLAACSIDRGGPLGGPEPEPVDPRFPKDAGVGVGDARRPAPSPTPPPREPAGDAGVPACATMCGGSCADLSVDPRNCGACGRTCATTQECMGGLCRGWRPLSATNAPAPRADHVAVWTGTHMFVWGGDPNGLPGLGPLHATGALYDPTADSWTAAPTPSVAGRRLARAGMAGSSVWIAGGSDGSGAVGSGLEFDTATGRWISFSSPVARVAHAAAYTGTQLVVWGGDNGSSVFADGALFSRGSPAEFVPSRGDVAPRRWAASAWAEQVSALLIWGGEDRSRVFAAGWTWSAAGWRAMSDLGAPSARARAVAVWTGSKLLVWGGDGGTTGSPYDYNAGTQYADGGAYDAAAGAWEPIARAPIGPHTRSVGAWSGAELLVWGGVHNGNQASAAGAAYDPATRAWRTLPTAGAPSPRWRHAAVWTGTELVVWGGAAGDNALGDGAAYTPYPPGVSR